MLRRRSYILEWQLWMHPYPTMIKNRRYRKNPGMIPYTKVISDRVEEAKKHTPAQLKRCVRAIVDKEGGEASREKISRAFAICTKSLQNKGYLKKGSQDPTKKGSKRGRSKAAEKGHKDKLAGYEKMLSVARGEE